MHPCIAAHPPERACVAARAGGSRRIYSPPRDWSLPHKSTHPPIALAMPKKALLSLSVDDLVAIRHTHAAYSIPYFLGCVQEEPVSTKPDERLRVIWLEQPEEVAVVPQGSPPTTPPESPTTPRRQATGGW